MYKRNSYKEILKALKRHPGLTETEIQIFCWGYRRSGPGKSYEANKKYADMLRRTMQWGLVYREHQNVDGSQFVYFVHDDFQERDDRRIYKMKRERLWAKREAAHIPKKETRAIFHQLLYEWVWENYLATGRIAVADIRKHMKDSENMNPMQAERWEALCEAYHNYLMSGCKRSSKKKYDHNYRGYWNWKIYSFERLNRHLKSIAKYNNFAWEFKKVQQGNVVRHYIIINETRTPFTLVEFGEQNGKTDYMERVALQREEHGYIGHSHETSEVRHENDRDEFTPGQQQDLIIELETKLLAAQREVKAIKLDKLEELQALIWGLQEDVNGLAEDLANADQKVSEAFEDNM